MNKVSTVALLDKCCICFNGRKEVSYYIFWADGEEAIKDWIKENVFYEPRIISIHKGNKYYIAKVEEWVD
ncbi:hypothetical protein [Desulfurobacterium indicum]|uniref:Uncharacterized protein n=1 Tax=Desulfurobacterium indicum TaxID=1914305 RepID=A0A1R1MJQ4_9BACT|nr:hypothetical protein [Desulfurobacterium indicum]OMH39930.1 hypothetical protein BLW93_07850 [Desulfurobacterium indicum]